MAAKQQPRKLKDFTQQKSNANKHTQRGMGVLEKSMQSVGYTSPMIAAADGEIIDGSARHEVAATVFGAQVEPILVESDGTRPIVVVRTDVPDAKSELATKISLYANRTAELNLDWDLDILKSLGDMKLLEGLWSEEERGNFQPVGIEQQGRLDEKKKVTCPNCGTEFEP